MEDRDNFYSPSTASSYRLQDELLTKSLLTSVIFIPILILLLMKIAVILKSAKTKNGTNEEEE